jgi:hypothetical protein
MREWRYTSNILDFGNGWKWVVRVCWTMSTVWGVFWPDAVFVIRCWGKTILLRWIRYKELALIMRPDYSTRLWSWKLWGMQEVGTFKCAAAAWISNYYLSQNIQFILYSGCASSLALSSSGVILLQSLSVTLLKWCFALKRYNHNCFSSVHLSTTQVRWWLICSQLMLYIVGRSVSIPSSLWLFLTQQSVKIRIRLACSFHGYTLTKDSGRVRRR